MRVKKRLCLCLLCCALLFLSGCTVLKLKGETSANKPNLGLLSMPAYEDAELDNAQSTEQAHMRVDLWLDASQVMGGINPNATSLYPHSSRKYREGGFHYRFENTVGMYENVLRDMLGAADGSRVRLLRYGNERLPDSFLRLHELADEGASNAMLCSLRRDLLTYAIDPMPTVFSAFSAEDMTDSFYSLGSAQLNQMASFEMGGGALLENAGQVAQMSAVLDQQIKLISAGNAGELTATRADTDYPLLYALQNIDLSRLSVIICDPATLRRLSGTQTDGSPIGYIEELLRERNIFDKGLSVGLYAFTLDYVGQLTSFGAADFSEPLLWGKLLYNSRTRLPAGVLAMPRTLLTLVIGQPSQVSAYTENLNKQLNADMNLKGLRGPEKGELVYTQNGQTLTQQPFSFAYQYTAVQRPSLGYYTQHSVGSTLKTIKGEGTVTNDHDLLTLTLTPDAHGRQEDRELLLTFPATALESGISADLSQLKNTCADVLSALLLTKTLPNDGEPIPASDAQVITLRDTLYVFERVDHPFAANKKYNPFTLKSIAMSADGQSLLTTIAVDGKKLDAGYYRLRICADLSGELLTWSPVAWIDGENSLSTTLTNEQIAQWEGFTAQITKFDRDSKIIPKQFQHAWGSSITSTYHGMPIPDFPPVSLALGLSELFSQLRAAANVEESPFLRCVFDVYTPGDEELR